MFTPPIGSLLDMDLSTVALSSDVPPKNSRGQPVQNSDGLVSMRQSDIGLELINPKSFSIPRLLKSWRWTQPALL